MTTGNFCFYLQNGLIQTSQTGGEWYSDTSPFSIPCHFDAHFLFTPISHVRGEGIADNLNY
jgi:hypothetical protein